MFPASLSFIFYLFLKYCEVSREGRGGGGGGIPKHGLDRCVAPDRVG